MIKTRTALLATAAMIAFPIAFETGKPGWKMDGDKLALDASGNPIYIKADGSETSVAGDTISRLNGEAKTHRERAEAAETKLEAFKGITDPAAAVKALETVSKLDQKKLIDAGEVDKVKAEISKTYEAQISEKDKALLAATERADNLTRSTAFATSDFVRDRVAVPPDMFQATFEKNFKIEDGKLVPYGPDGNKIYSKKRMGEVAEPDEAFEILLETHPHKDQILKAPSAGGSGSGGGGGNRGSGRTISRADFAKLAPADQAAAAGLAQKGEMTIVD